MIDKPLISVIMPAYNAELFIEAAINSILGQTYPNWELLLVNDGSTDGTEAILAKYTDPRIRKFSKPNGGIGSARNLALAHVRGEFLAFLDADDVLPADSIASRLRIFATHPDTDMIDGVVHCMDRSLTKVLRSHYPDFRGAPLAHLVTLSDRAFFGLSWMLRWPKGHPQRFVEGVSHAEDLHFFIRYAAERYYRATTDTVLLYRVSGSSSMSDLNGLDRSYQQLSAWLLRDRRYATLGQAFIFIGRSRRAMVGAFWNKGEHLKALCAATLGLLGTSRFLTQESNPFIRAARDRS